MTKFRTILIMVASAAMLSLGPAAPSVGAPAGDCMTDQQIQAAIASGQIQSWPKIKKLGKIPGDAQEVSDVRVCMIKGVPYYTVNVVTPNGAASKVVLNAIDGSP
jgi:uncharacterized membrane protein YkoI